MGSVHRVRESSPCEAWKIDELSMTGSCRLVGHPGARGPGAGTHATWEAPRPNPRWLVPRDLISWLGDDGG